MLNLALTSDEFIHLRYMLGGSISFKDQAEKWHEQSHLKSLLSKLISAEKDMYSAENENAFDRSTDVSIKISGPGREVIRVE